MQGRSLLLTHVVSLPRTGLTVVRAQGAGAFTVCLLMLLLPPIEVASMFRVTLRARVTYVRSSSFRHTLGAFLVARADGFLVATDFSAAMGRVLIRLFVTVPAIEKKFGVLGPPPIVVVVAGWPLLALVIVPL